MKNYSAFLVCFLITLQIVFAQPCQKTGLHSARERRELKRFIKESDHRGFFYSAKGVIVLQIYQDTLGQTNWWAKVEYEDRYKEYAPLGWMRLAGKVILVYESVGWRGNVPTLEELKCLEKIVNDYVVERPPIPDPEPILDSKGQPVLDGNGKPLMKIRGRTLVGGGPGNSTHFTFQRDGRVIRLKGV